MAESLGRADARAAVSWSAAALLLYLATAARGLVWADSSKLTLYALASYLPTLNPGDHAGWTLIAEGWLRLAGGDPVTAAHRLSAVAGAAVAGLLFLVLRARGAGPERAHTAVAVVTVALPVWWAATVAETYMPAVALTLAAVLLLRPPTRGWRWVMAGIACGLALACHAMAVVLAAPLLWEAEGRRWWRVVPGAVVGTAPMWLAVWGGPVDPLTGFAAGGGATWRWHWEAFVAAARVPRGAAVLTAIVLYGVGVLGVKALWNARREGRAGAVWAASLGLLTVMLTAYAPYRLHLMTTFLVVGIALAVPMRLGPAARLAHLASQAALYLAVPAVVTLAGKQDLGVRVLPGRNNAFYFLCPVKDVGWARELWKPASLFDPGADLYVGTLGACAPPSAVVVSDFNAGAPLRLAQRARGWRRDLDVHAVAVDVALASPDPAAALEAEIGRALARGPVVLADTYRPYYRLDAIAARFTVSPCRAGALVSARPERGGS
ncbi:MAG TPA: hypothetical protein VMT19_12825 [Thermoanaerobaculaceae bacterium]|nr:hypothetical protein [Thermoanaerobaculaceae bacterium]